MKRGTRKGVPRFSLLLRHRPESPGATGMRRYTVRLIRYLSASRAALHPLAAAVMAWR